ncbi:Stress-induced acidophilic repeat motif-containing protein [Hymenobacter daecheongensis DSM 21074]|uniref:Stress-induced acidophilic repeat motif-containing protein n=1 Tax=Hymenobacter daecheongensis DSM 21074 TaxID=1121955 RepID=A0A1M6F440_9BACT|nr:KGG domain-containing protein [Hymenobacter daecheongensis]SHI92441.1 Stress-induced acidophilic repeat motif-containing protein [Hymenobacter daecheongensis DSM 21074]
MITHNQAQKTTAPRSAEGSRLASQGKATSVNGKSVRGFAAMDPAEQRRIASEGGRASHESGRGHRFTSEEARAAGRKGGQASRRTGSANAVR